jgi:EAL domain-containing protein (putative c-di-GMP-specific phosphodiesterase class I)
VSHPEDGHRLAMALRVALEGEVIFDANPLDLSVSMGLALAPVHAGDCEALLRHVESALFEAKRQRVACVVYAPSLEALRVSQLTLLSELNTAVSDNQLRMFLQPKFGVQDGRLHGFEALVRWRHPVRGWVSPAEFIPFAESSGRIRDITRWMLRSAINQLQAWRTTEPRLWIAVNISTLDLLDNGLPEFIAQALHGTGVAARQLQLELTESGLMAAGPDPVRTLDTLRHLGLHLAIDDFGTGQSSLAYLQRLPVHELKIDRSFVDGFDTHPRRRSLLGSIVGLGHSLGLTVTAEGVETEAELQALRESGCDLVQGYLLGRPMDPQALLDWMTQRSLDPAPVGPDGPPTGSGGEHLQRV